MTIACERFDAAAKQILRARWRRDVDGALVCRWVPERAIPTGGQSGREERLTPIPATKSHLTTLDSDAEADRVAEQHSYASHLPQRAWAACRAFTDLTPRPTLAPLSSSGNCNRSSSDASVRGASEAPKSADLITG